jgi:23S rRNA (pseudouridine1915-N3)-methyltransferase
MQHIIIAVGKLKPGAQMQLLQHYAKQIRPAPKLIELADAPSNMASDARKRKEAGLFEKHLPKGATIIALDSRGKSLTSENLAQTTSAQAASGKPICWLIGGQDGLDASLINRADFTLSFGQLTWPHKLVRIMLMEQLFRIQSIENNHPYHLGH